MDPLEGSGRGQPQPRPRRIEAAIRRGRSGLGRNADAAVDIMAAAGRFRDRETAQLPGDRSRHEAEIAVCIRAAADRLRQDTVRGVSGGGDIAVAGDFGAAVEGRVLAVAVAAARIAADGQDAARHACRAAAAARKGLRDHCVRAMARRRDIPRIVGDRFVPFAAIFAEAEHQPCTDPAAAHGLDEHAIGAIAFGGDSHVRGDLRLTAPAAIPGQHLREVGSGPAAAARRAAFAVSRAAVAAKAAHRDAHHARAAGRDAARIRHRADARGHALRFGAVAACAPAVLLSKLSARSPAPPIDAARRPR
ncbi:hypothetical protein [Mangrovicoccus sp. HB161399]|uniref:hypothetical protein n=1 Tax=Mangrovicoccus sp. HB161399 TaxID=2720392 RepID=UPI001552288E|nr:hypothetical protein [Mangrovicoccus sp. HB161399]